MALEARPKPVETLARAAGRIAAGGDLRTAVGALAAAVAEAVDAELVVIRVAEHGELVARAAAPAGSTLAAEAVGTRAAVEAIEAAIPSDVVERVALTAGAEGVIVEPARAGDRVFGSIEAVRLQPFSSEEHALVGLAAAQAALAVRTLAPGTHSAAGFRRAAWLGLSGEALAAAADPRRAAEQTVRIAAEATGARGGVVWRIGVDSGLQRLATVGPVEGALERAAVLAREAVTVWRPARVEYDGELPEELPEAVTLPLGQPPFAALQLFYAEGTAPAEPELAGLAAFAARAAHALRSGEKAVSVELELRRTRALLEVVSEAVSRLSLSHTLETAVERVGELLQVEQLGVYLRDGGRLRVAAARGVGDELDRVVERVSDALLGPLRARTSVHAHVAGREPALAAVRAALAAAGERSVVALPLNVREESIGLLVAYPGDRLLTESDLASLAALAAQLAVAVQNARLHERATELGAELSHALDLERLASRQVNALYEISRSFAQTLSLDTTLDTVAETLVAELGVDAAVIRVPDERGDQLVPHAVRVAEERLTGAVEAILRRPQPRRGRPTTPMLLDVPTVRRLGGAHALLRPFLEKGSTAAVLPIATTSELLAELTIVSLDPAQPISADTLATARTIAQQAALAVDNARLYQQQKRFAETMQQSLLPREHPSVEGLEVGSVYESAAQVDVGGDVYDFLELADGRLAVVLGDVTGHGIDATADMAMAKFVFRSLAREHPEPSAFLSHANEVVVGEIELGKFITMAYVTVDPAGVVLCASAGHPETRIVTADGVVEALTARGLALGIDAPQRYEQVRALLPAGASVVLYTDGVIESRRGRELFGAERLDRVLTANAGRSAQEIADAVLAECRAFAGGALPDDCAVVVIRRLSTA
jgi:serine phosphatase RsbU (regulator of sigma subunit)